MHPALSVIFFTVSSGAGFGLIAMLGFGFPMRGDMLSAFLICLLGGGLSAAGLISSTFHLGHPERALRAFSQWRSSWLSREGVAAVLCLLVFAAYSLLWMFTGERNEWLGWASALLAIATVFTTAMIYTQIKTVPTWHSAITPVCYLAFSAASGFLLAASFSNSFTLFGFLTPHICMALILFAWIAKIIWWSRALKVGFSDTGSNTGTATGLGHLGKVRLLERPHTGENYLTKEMVHQIGRKHANKLRVLSLIFGLLIPLVLCFFALSSSLATYLLIAASISFIGALFAERWLFFAEAKHSVSLFY
ncbi:MAG: dimethyl sulfoxide reductase anchor subunit family protein [Nitratireductor sp.]